MNGLPRNRVASPFAPIGFGPKVGIGIGKDPEKIRTILVRSPNWIGDAVLSSPALRGLKEALPGAAIDVLARPWVAEVFAAEPYIRRVIPYRDGRGGEHFGFRGRLKLARQLGAHRYDLAVLFPRSFESALVPFLARIPSRVGWAADGRSLLLTHAVSLPALAEEGHEIRLYSALLRSAGIDVVAGGGVELTLRDEERERAREILGREGAGPGRLRIGFNPGAAFGSAKRWPAQAYSDLLRRLVREKGAVCVLFGSMAEKPIAEQIARESGEGAVDLAGRLTLRETFACLAAMDAVVTNDSGLMHASAALGRRLVAIFGPTDPEATGPVGPACRVVRTPVECSPCYLRECPIDHRCMTRVDPTRVLSELDDLLQAP